MATKAYCDAFCEHSDGGTFGRSKKRKGRQGTFLVVQWLGLCAPNAGGLGLIPG